MRAILQFFGWANLGICAAILAGSLAASPTAEAYAIPVAPNCAVCGCTVLNKVCASQKYSGCSGLCDCVRDYPFIYNCYIAATTEPTS